MQRTPLQPMGDVPLSVHFTIVDMDGGPKAKDGMFYLSTEGEMLDSEGDPFCFKSGAEGGLEILTGGSEWINLDVGQLSMLRRIIEVQDDFENANEDGYTDDEVDEEFVSASARAYFDDSEFSVSREASS
ncbi:hypothetical protein [Mesorhizobium sp. M0244]|uniref:hypothetical protein n=1 Tax=Mesorhizobium sp. M0244 TaxID=2956926 RepID=UPI00333BEC9B